MSSTVNIEDRLYMSYPAVNSYMHNNCSNWSHQAPQFQFLMAY